MFAEDGAVAGPVAQATAAELLDWLLATQAGEPHARARRLGIVEIIWFERLWTSGARAWAPYQAGACLDPTESNTTCHRDHVHFGFSTAGADGKTSWWQGLLGWLQSTLAELTHWSLIRPLLASDRWLSIRVRGPGLGPGVGRDAEFAADLARAALARAPAGPGPP